jgi:multiple sugar transport system substrate-binding protein
VLPAFAGGNQDNQAEVSANQKVKLVVWGGVPPENGPKTVCDEFMKLNPDIEVEWVRYVNDDQGNVKLDTALMSGEQIDVYFTQFEDLYAKRIQGGSAENLSPWLEKDNFDMVKSYGEGFWVYNDQVYGLPTNYDFQFVFVNEDMFKSAGIPIPKSWTWDEYAAITARLTRMEGGIQVFGGFMNWQDVGRYILRGQVLGADSFYKSPQESNFDAPIYRKSLELFDRLMMKDKSHLSFVEINNAKLSPYGELLTGKAATCISAPWIIRYINNQEQYPHTFKISAVPLPTTAGESKNYGWPGLTSVIMMNQKSKNKEAAFKYIKYFGMNGQLFMCGAGKIPSWKGINRDQALNNMLGANPEQRFDSNSFRNVLFDESIKPFFNTQFNKFAQIERIWKEEVEKFVSGGQNIEITLKNAKTRSDAEL